MADLLLDIKDKRMAIFEMVIVFLFVIAGVIMMQEGAGKGPRLMVGLLLAVFVIFKMNTV